MCGFVERALRQGDAHENHKRLEAGVIVAQPFDDPERLGGTLLRGRELSDVDEHERAVPQAERGPERVLDLARAGDDAVGEVQALPEVSGEMVELDEVATVHGERLDETESIAGLVRLLE